MLKLLLRRFVKDDDIKNPDTRRKYGVLGGIFGIICNLLLFAVKLVSGIMINSIAVVSDAFNNLSDLGSSLVSVFGSRMSGKTADEEHPYDQGRAEYISALIISMLIIFFGFELLKNSVSEIFSPSEVSLSIVSVALLVISVPVKLWLWYANRYMGKKIDSEVLLRHRATALTTVLQPLRLLFQRLFRLFVAFPIDGIAGLCVLGTDYLDGYWHCTKHG